MLEIVVQASQLLPRSYILSTRLLLPRWKTCRTSWIQWLPSEPGINAIFVLRTRLQLPS